MKERDAFASIFSARILLLAAALLLGGPWTKFPGYSLRAAYDAWTAIDHDNVFSVTNPAANEVWLIQSPHDLTCSATSDKDCNLVNGEVEDDDLTYYWEATGGVFENNDNIGQQVSYFCPDAATTGDYTVTANADDNYAAAGNDALANEAKKPKDKTFKVVVPSVVQVSFTGDHALEHTPSANGGWADGTTAISDPIYNADDAAADQAKKNHVSYTKGSSSGVTVKAVLRVPHVLTESSAFTLFAEGTNTWNWDTGSFGTTSDLSSEVPCTLSGALEDKVRKIGSYSVAWKFKCALGLNQSRDLSATTHTMYLTYGTPGGSDVTVKRINQVCTMADGKTSAAEVAEAVNGVSNAFDLSATIWGPTPIWLLYDGESAQCPGIALFVGKHFEMVGLGAGEIRYCYAKADGTYDDPATSVGTQWRAVPGTTHAAGTTHDDGYTLERLSMVDGGGGPNNYEAALKFGGKYYCGPVGVHSTPKAVVTSAFTSIEWQYRTGAGTAGDPYVFHACAESPWTEAP